MIFFLSKRFESHHNGADKSKQLGFDKLPQDVPLKLRRSVFRCGCQRDVVIHIRLTVGHGGDPSCGDSEHCRSQDEPECHPGVSGCWTGPADGSLGEAPETAEGILGPLRGAARIRPRCVIPVYRREHLNNNFCPNKK